MSQGPTFVIVGAGGLGCPLAVALAPRAGRLVIVDDDRVEVSNLQRQVLYRTEDVGRPKAAAARAALARRFPGLAVEAVAARFDEASARALVHDADVVCDGTDDLGTKFLVNDACVALGRRFVIGGVVRYTGQVFPVRPGVDACYRCLFEAVPEEELATCADAGVLGAMCGVVAAWQAEAAWALAGGGGAAEPTLGAAWIFDSLPPPPRGWVGIYHAGLTPRRVRFNRRPGCQACGHMLEATA